MTLINNLSMRGKLITLVLPALLVIVFFAFQSISRNMDDLGNMQQLKTMVQLAKLGGDPLVEALQKERGGRSAVFISSAPPDSDGEREATRNLQSQRQDTDRNLTTYQNGIKALAEEARFDSSIQASLDKFQRDIGNLINLRRDIDNRALAGAESGAATPA